MTENLTYQTDDDGTEILPVGEWFDELTWSPSQCYYHLQHKEVDYILYLRWRWTDPWQAYVVKNAASLAAMNRVDVDWSADVFELHQIQFQDIDLEPAKNRFIQLFNEFDGNFTQLRVPQEKTQAIW